jgi:N-acetylneuraminic acid mutarotase
MKKLHISAALVLCVAIAPAADKADRVPSLPVAVSGNAVASVREGLQIFSIMGVGPKKTWDDVTNKLFVMDMGSAKWREGRTVPGAAGRLNAAAAGARGVVVLMGGYVVDDQDHELIVPDVNVYEPGIRRWSRGTDIPVAVDSAVSGAMHDRYIYLIGGRSSAGPVNKVQVYDIQKGTWSEATPFPGTPVFGLAGGVADGEIVIVDGARAGAAGEPRYVASNECWLGKIDKKDPNKIEWSKLPAHPGAARFGIAGGGAGREHRIYFSGGTATPHDYKGVAYDGKPAEASSVTFAYDLHRHQWETISETASDPRADSRGVLMTPVGPVVLGGMTESFEVTALVTVLTKK